jgi:hypothetical protein
MLANLIKKAGIHAVSQSDLNLVIYLLLRRNLMKKENNNI